MVHHLDQGYERKAFSGWVATELKEECPQGHRGPEKSHARCRMVLGPRRWFELVAGEAERRRPQPGACGPRLQLEAAARPRSLGDIYGLLNDGRVITLMKNSLRAMRKPGGISEVTVTQAEYAARGLATGHEGLASPLPCSARPSSAAPGGRGAEAPAGSPSAKPRAKPMAHCHGRQARG